MKTTSREDRIILGPFHVAQPLISGLGVSKSVLRQNIIVSMMTSCGVITSEYIIWCHKYKDEAINLIVHRK